MDDLLARIWCDLIGRVSGPMKFRLVLQPLMAIIFAVRGAIRDAREGKPPYFWALLTNPEERQQMLKSGWKDVGRIFILAIIIDVAYQLSVFRWLYPVELVIVAIILAITPYLLIRGLLNRILQRGRSHSGKTTHLSSVASK